METSAATSTEKATAEGKNDLLNLGSSEASTSAVKNLKPESQDKDREQPGTIEVVGEGASPTPASMDKSSPAEMDCEAASLKRPHEDSSATSQEQRLRRLEKQWMVRDGWKRVGTRPKDPVTGEVRHVVIIG
ncbi:hypothetical protein IscW_ISCW013485 [Ixodes scapularis]|uniref:Uncharacterized protein n=1 Tax=Ixodes scapularis TaxID=6945 RepID=B7QFG9_IXOSC|nr:hypothetical protein IscW_ISCW013485 [Ixodes scapularis]|eukprot:XP_002414283.1 hypothetical protein IscW_ISCW013485 [Ixodes scapularis]